MTGPDPASADRSDPASADRSDPASADRSDADSDHPVTDRPGDRDVPADRAFVCDECGRRWYYDRRRCPACGHGAESAATVRLETGAVVATTTVETTPPDVRAPNHLALVRFDDVQLIAQAASGDLSPGDAVRFEGTHRLRETRDRTDPRLVAGEDA